MNVLSQATSKPLFSFSLQLRLYRIDGCGGKFSTARECLTVVGGTYSTGKSERNTHYVQQWQITHMLSKSSIYTLATLRQEEPGGG